MQTEEFKILLALEPSWTASINGREFVSLKSSDIEVAGDVIRFGKFTRRVTNVRWTRSNSLRVLARRKYRSEMDVIVFFPGERLPSTAEHRRRRRLFQNELAAAIARHFGVRSIERQILHSDKQHGIGGSYPRFVTRSRAAIAVDPNESSAIVNGLMRAAVLWSPLVKRPLSVIVPVNRRSTVVSRLRSMPDLRRAFEWLQWDERTLVPLNFDVADPETRIHPFNRTYADREAARLTALAPDLLQAIPDIRGDAISIRLRGIEVARVAGSETTYPISDDLDAVIGELAEKRRYGSRHPLARAHEERWLESNLIGDIQRILPWANPGRLYPQVPSFVGEDRNIIDLLTITESGRIVVIEVKASPDPDLPFQAFDYWLAVEKHRKAGDFQRFGYFPGVLIKDEPALLVVVAPLLAFHKTFDRLSALLPEETAVMQIGLDQAWKREIKILRRKGLLG